MVAEARWTIPATVLQRCPHAWDGRHQWGSWMAVIYGAVPGATSTTMTTRSGDRWRACRVCGEQEVRGG